MDLFRREGDEVRHRLRNLVAACVHGVEVRTVAAIARQHPNQAAGRDVRDGYRIGQQRDAEPGDRRLQHHS